MRAFTIRIFSVLILITTLTIGAVAQKGVISGRAYNDINNEPVPFANVYIKGTTTGTTTDFDGNYRLENLEPGFYTVACSFIGFEEKVVSEVRVNSSRPTQVDFALVATTQEIGVAEIETSAFERQEESPVSLRTISATEIYRSPGGNRDISKVIQILPGVASTVSFRNDVIVRGGAPNENRFFLDGIEVPNINHFATQGSSGGPVGLINVNFIQSVDFYAGAFPANRGNALSSVMDFTQISGNREKLTGTFMIGSSDIGLTLDGPVGQKSTAIFSLRRSYLQFLFKALKLPFLPTYTDFQLKQSIDINAKNQLTIIGLGAIDDFELNTSVNEGITDSALIQRNDYTIANLPVNTQWNYTAGLSWKHFSDNSFQTFVLSRNHLNNRAEKYRNNVEVPEALVLDYQSEEIENKFRFEHTWRNDGWKWNAGIGVETARYLNSTYNELELGGEVQILDFDSELEFMKYSAFTQLSKQLLDNRLILSAGLRTDFADYSSATSNPLDQLSPRFSASYALSEKWFANFNVGRYYQYPPFTVLGYRNNNGALVNKENDVTLIQADHIVGGLEYNPTAYSKITVEGFLKDYDHYPFLLADSISLANLGGDFGVIGNEPANSTSQGRSYGVEVFLQQKLSSSLYGILSYTYVRSEFRDKNGDYVPSAWDNRHILNIVAGRRFENNWELGFKFRFLGGAPYTPYDRELSALIPVWDVTQMGVVDWDRLNTERNPNAHGLDIRVDKKWFFQKWSVNAYVDIQNIYNFQAEGQPFLDVVRDGNGNPVEDPDNPGSYVLYELSNQSGTFLPSVGLMIEF